MDEKTGVVNNQQSPSSEQDRLPVRAGQVDFQAFRGDEEDLGRIRERIKSTEAQLAGTIDEIQEKLSLEHMAKQAEEKVLDALERRAADMAESIGKVAGQFGETVWEAIKQNPIPVALMGLGVSWLLVQGLGGSSEEENQTYSRTRYRESSEEGGEYSAYRRTAAEARGSVQDAAESMREKAGEVRHKVGDYAENFMEKAKQVGSEARRTGSGFWEKLEDNALVAGVAALSLGAVLGFIVPKMRREEELIGEARQTLTQKAKDLGRSTLEKAERVVEETRRAVREEAREQGLTVEATLDKAGQVVEEGRKAAQQECCPSN